MFTMMNEARLGVGMQGVAQAEVAFQKRAWPMPRTGCRARDVTGPKKIPRVPPIR